MADILAPDILAYDGLTVEDRVDLQTLCMEYVWRIDHGYPSTIPELFAEDGVWDGLWGHLVGKAQLVQGWNKRSENPIRTRHLITNLRFHRESSTLVKGWISYIFFKAQPGEQPGFTPDHVGEHVDTYVKTAAGWRFKSRRVEVAFAD